MRSGRTFFLAGLAEAVAGFFAAPRSAASRRAALDRLQASVRRSGGISAFAGAPCAAQDETVTRGPSPALPDAGREGS
jgi:hypothetical protein